MSHITSNFFFILDVFPSNFYDWEPLESFTGVFEVIHADIGKLMYNGLSATKLVSKGVYFYNPTYIVPKKGGHCSL